MEKLRKVVSYENMSAELLQAFKDKYPKGYADYMGDLFKIDKPDGTFFYAVTLETLDSIYLVKIKVKIDDYEEAEKDLDDEDDNIEEGDVGFPDEADSSFQEEATEDDQE
jgi:hypothetical protein